MMKRIRYGDQDALRRPVEGSDLPLSSVRPLAHRPSARMSAEFDDILGGDADRPRRGRPTNGELARRAAERMERASHQARLTRAARGETLVKPEEFRDMVVGRNWLGKAFGMDPDKTVKKRLANVEPHARMGHNRELYLLTEIIPYLLKPKMDIASYLATLNPTDMPTAVSKAFWEAMRIRQRTLLEAGSLWRDEQVLEVLGRVFMLIKERIPIITEGMREEGLTDAQARRLEEYCDQMRNELHAALVEEPRQRTTLPHAAELEPFANPETDASFFDGDDDRLMFASLQQMVLASAEAVRPPERIDVPTAAERYHIVKTAGQHAGPFSLAKTPYLREPMEVLTSLDYTGMIFAGPARTGKALALDTPIATPSGWTTMGALNVGDAVFDENGVPCTVVATTEVMRNHECFTVRFSDGATIVADRDHQWSVEDCHRPGQRRTLTTGEMVATHLFGKESRSRYAVPVAQPLNLAESALPLDPYVLGAWLGDGSTDKSELTAGAEDAEAMGVNIPRNRRSSESAPLPRRRLRDPLVGSDLWRSRWCACAGDIRARQNVR